jgi:hypothetical protein
MASQIDLESSDDKCMGFQSNFDILDFEITKLEMRMTALESRSACLVSYTEYLANYLKATIEYLEYCHQARRHSIQVGALDRMASCNEPSFDEFLKTFKPHSDPYDIPF